MNKNKKYLLKGLFLALTLILLDRIWIDYRTASLRYEVPFFWVATTFGIMVIAFVKTKKLKNLLIMGVVCIGALIITALVFMMAVDLGILTARQYITYEADRLIKILIFQVVGSLSGAIATIILTAIKVSFNDFKKLCRIER